MSASASGLPVIASRYHLIEKLGEGGMGEVYRAKDRLTNQMVALKRVLLTGQQLQFASRSTTFKDSNDFRLTLAQEFRTLASLRHPNIISVLDYGFDETRQPYFTMELLENAQTLVDFGRGQPLTVQIDLIIRLLQALAYLHRRGIVHRDLKPDNAMVVNGQVKVLDFGLAIAHERLQENKGVAGTLAYIAPEVLQGRPVSEASDLFAVGIMAYELLVGRHPFLKTPTTSLVIRVLTEFPDLSTLDEPLSLVIGRLLAKTPDSRYDSADEVIAALCDATAQPLVREEAALRESFLQAAKFVGREQELEILTGALHKIIHRQSGASGSAWLIGGESGIGKSRLLEEVSTHALIAGAVVLRGQGVEGGGLSYQLWREPLHKLALSTVLNDLEAAILKEIVPEISTLLGREIPDAPELEGQAAQQRLALTIVDVFKRQTQPIVMLLEDLQWTSESLEILRQLIRFVSEGHWLIVGSYRTDESPDLPEKLPGMETLKLGRMDEASIADLSAAMLGEAGRQPHLVDLLKRETEGNAFFMVEVVRALAEEVGTLGAVAYAELPQSVFAGGIQQMVRRRLGHIPEWTLRPLRLAAIAGRHIDIRLLQTALEKQDISLNGINDKVDLDVWLTVCANAAVLEVMNNQWRFAHDKLREMMLADMTENERPSLHRVVAQSIEAVHPNIQSYAESLADHWYAAHEPDKALSWSLTAADNLIELTAEYGRAKQLLERAFMLLEGSSELGHYRPRLLMLLGDVERLRGEYTQAISHYQAGLALSEDHLDRVTSVRILSGLSRAMWQQGDNAVAAEYARRGVEIAEKIDDKRSKANSLNSLGNIAAFGESDYISARRFYEESLRLRREIDDRAGISASLNNLGIVAHDEGHYEQAQKFYEESLIISREIGDRQGIALTLINLGSVTHDRGDYVATRTHYEESLAISKEIGDRWGAALTLYNLGNVTREEGDLTSANVYYDASLKAAREMGDKQGVAFSLNGLGKIAFRRASYREAQDCFQQSLSVSREIGNQSLIVDALNALAFVELSMNNLADAKTYLREAMGIVQSLMTAPMMLKLILTTARWLLRSGQTEYCVRLLGLVDAHSATVIDTRQEWLPVVSAEAENMLSAEAFITVKESGKSLVLETILTHLLQILNEGELDNSP